MDNLIMGIFKSLAMCKLTLGVSKDKLLQFQSVTKFEENLPTKTLYKQKSKIIIINLKI